MKKFLSLVLALVMTMSLFTISAGATEYKDLTDKDKIQYPEAVAVLNKLGIIAGYEDGSFNPTASLTRGAAAKIIVSMMIGSDAAKALTAATAPYKDVPVSNTFAGYISYCKTAGYINGYSDGTFRPATELTGYAFAKMLLGALGYKGDIEGFSGEGWTMNVAKIGNKAGLFNDITGFSGSTALTREVACQLALNTLKATEVQYTGSTTTVVTGSATVTTGNNTSSYVTSNNTSINGNINNKRKDTTSGQYTLEFGEEHFTNLKLYSTTDDFGAPSNQWTYKSAEIGTFAKKADFTFTAGASGDTAADKVKSMGIKGYKVADENTNANATNIQMTIATNGKDSQATYTSDELALEAIAGATANGTVVELYLSDSEANTITNVVVKQTQLMKVDKVASTYVTLKQVDGLQGNAANTNGVAVKKVEDDNANYKTLSAMKADDYVLITPVTTDGDTYTVFSAVAPTTAAGKLTTVSLKTDNSKVNGVTVGGTAYKMSALWSSVDNKLTTATKPNSTTDATIYLDSYGYVIYAKNVEAGSSYFVFDENYSSLVDGKIVNIEKGWDLDGNAVSLNFGTVNPGYSAGDVYEYTTSTKHNADYEAVTSTKIFSGKVSTTAGTASIRAGAATVQSAVGAPYVFNSDVKFLFVTSSTDDTVTGVTLKNGVQKVSENINYQFVLDSDNHVKAVIVSKDTDIDAGANILYISAKTGTALSSSNSTVSKFTAYIDGVETKDCVSTKDNAVGKLFYTYSVDTNGIYTLKDYTTTGSDNKATSVLTGANLTVANILNNTYISTITGVGGTATDLNAANAKVVDLVTNDGVDYSTLKDLAKSGKTSFGVSLVYNNNADSANYKKVSYIFVESNGANADYSYTTALTGGSLFADAACAYPVAVGTALSSGQTLYVKSSTPLQAVTGVTGLTGFTKVADPTAATDCVVYSATVTGAVSGAVAATTNWYTVTIGTATATASGVTFTASATSATQIVEKNTGDATITVKVTGTVASAMAATGIITMKNCATNTVTADGTPTNMDATANTPGAPTIATTTTNGAVSGTYTIAMSGITGNVSVVVSAA